MRYIQCVNKTHWRMHRANPDIGSNHSRNCLTKVCDGPLEAVGFVNKIDMDRLLTQNLALPYIYIVCRFVQCVLFHLNKQYGSREWDSRIIPRYTCVNIHFEGNNPWLCLHFCRPSHRRSPTSQKPSASCAKRIWHGFNFKFVYINLSFVFHAQTCICPTLLFNFHRFSARRLIRARK